MCICGCVAAEYAVLTFAGLRVGVYLIFGCLFLATAAVTTIPNVATSTMRLNATRHLNIWHTATPSAFPQSSVEQVAVVVSPMARKRSPNEIVQRRSRKVSKTSTGKGDRPQQQRRIEVMRRLSTVADAAKTRSENSYGVRYPSFHRFQMKYPRMPKMMAEQTSWITRKRKNGSFGNVLALAARRLKRAMDFLMKLKQRSG